MNNDKKISSLELDEYYTPIPVKYISPTPGEITLVASSPNLNVSGLDGNLCEEIKNCGFNAVSAVIGSGYIAESLNNCNLDSLKLILGNGNLTNQYYEAFVNENRNKPALGGWLMQQRISKEELYTNSDIYIYTNNLKTLYSSFTNVSDPLIFISLKGEEAENPTENDYANYKEYVSLFIENFGPTFLPYFSKFILTNSVGSNFLFNQFYNNLEIFSFISRYLSVPFWTYCQCMTYSSPVNNSLQVLREQDIRFQVFSALAYGAQGIFYYNYRQNSDTSTEQYKNAPITREGVKTPTWNYVQQVNKEVRIYNDIFVGCELVQCRHTGTHYFNTKSSRYPIGPLISITGPSVSNTGFQVSHIFNNEKDYLVIINRNLENAVSINLLFSTNWDIYLLDNDGFSYQKFKFKLDNNNIFSTFINKGGYLIFTWE